jgi:tellurium resistance protein TerD
MFLHRNYTGALTFENVCRDKTFGRAVRHNGDNRTGKGSGDDERIDIDLDYMPDEVKVLWVVVNVYTAGATFSQVKGAYIRLCAARNGHEFCKFRLDEGPNSRGLVLAKIFRNAAARWCVMAVGQSCGRNSESISRVFFHRNILGD